MFERVLNMPLLLHGRGFIILEFFIILFSSITPSVIVDVITCLKFHHYEFGHTILLFQLVLRSCSFMLCSSSARTHSCLFVFCSRSLMCYLCLLVFTRALLVCTRVQLCLHVLWLRWHSSIDLFLILCPPPSTY